MPEPPTPTVEPVIVTTKAALEAAIAAGLERILRKSRPDLPPSEPRQGFGWVTNAEAMRLLGLSKPTLARYRASGKLPYAKVGSSVYYRLADIEGLLEDRLVGAPDSAARPRPTR